MNYILGIPLIVIGLIILFGFRKPEEVKETPIDLHKIDCDKSHEVRINFLCTTGSGAKTKCPELNRTYQKTK